jgi:hypothetical protein
MRHMAVIAEPHGPLLTPWNGQLRTVSHPERAKGTHPPEEKNHEGRGEEEKLLPLRGKILTEKVGVSGHQGQALDAMEEEG